MTRDYSKHDLNQSDEHCTVCKRGHGPVCTNCQSVYDNIAKQKSLVELCQMVSDNQDNGFYEVVATDDEAMSAFDKVKIAHAATLEALKEYDMEDTLNTNRQIGKPLMGPLALCKIFGFGLRIGSLKGYVNKSWWLSQPGQTDTDIMESAKRHFEAVESAPAGSSYEYDEYDKDGNVLPEKGNHIYQLFWNVAVLALRHYFGKHKDDRWLGS